MTRGTAARCASRSSCPDSCSDRGAQSDAAMRSDPASRVGTVRVGPRREPASTVRRPRRAGDPRSSGETRVERQPCTKARGARRRRRRGETRRVEVREPRARSSPAIRGRGCCSPSIAVGRRCAAADRPATSRSPRRRCVPDAHPPEPWRRSRIPPPGAHSALLVKYSKRHRPGAMSTVRARRCEGTHADLCGGGAGGAGRGPPGWRS